MTAPRYTQLRAAAQVAEIHTAQYEDLDFIVIPVCAMVGGAVVRPLNSEGPEYVDESVLRVAPGQWANRPVLPDHPEGGTASANDPKILEAQRYGWTFNAEYRAGKLHMEAWLDSARAAKVGGEAQRVVEAARRALAGEDVEPIEVSIGAWVVLAKENGVSPSGVPYEYRWLDAYSDHLACGLNGSRGACSVEDGCGAIRSNAEETPPVRQAVLRAAVLGQARRPTFTGTETSAWSAPSWADYVRHLHEGREGPGSVGQASAALKREVAAHSLLGDPEASNMGALTMFPVVNPSNGKLNERALRAVLGGRGAQADIPEGARTSARDMARRLLNSEFGAELEAAKMSEEKSENVEPKARAAAESTNVTAWLEEALQAAEGGFEWLWVESFDAEAGTVVYGLRNEGEPSRTYQRTYELDGETVTLGEERTAVRRRVSYEPVPEVTAAKSAGSALPAMLVKALEALGFRTAEDGTSDVDLRERMWKALNSSVPGFVDIAEIFPETKTVIYSTRPEESLAWFRRTYEQFESVVTLNDDAEQVEIEQSWKPVAARAEPGEQATLEFQHPAEAGNPADCGCHGNGQAAPSQSTEGGPMTKVEEIVGRLTANARCPYDDNEKDKAHLGSLSEEKLKALDAAFAEKPATEPEPAKDPPKATEASPPAEQKAEGEKAEPPAADTVNLKREEYEDILAAAKAHKAEQARRHSALVAQLKGAQDGFTEEDLKALPIEQLSKLARSLKVETKAEPDYSGRALASASESTNHAPPDPYAAQLTAMRKDRGLPVGKEAN